MKIAITGHTKGIGKALFDNLIKAGHTCYGFSRSNGYDITDKQSQENIIGRSLKCDVFINNAYNGFSQEELLDLIYNEWKDCDDKTIVVINSRTRFGVARNRVYAHSKKQLHHKTIKCFSDPEKRCRVISISPGYVKTNMTSTDEYSEFKMMTPEELAELISWCINQPQHIEIGELSCWYTTLK